MVATEAAIDDLQTLTLSDLTKILTDQQTE
jgi:hypothetical protein